MASITVSVAGQPNQVVALPGGEPAVFDLPAGVLTVNANGTWSFAAKISLDQTPAPPRCRSRWRSQTVMGTRTGHAQHHSDGRCGCALERDCRSDG